MTQSDKPQTPRRSLFSGSGLWNAFKNFAIVFSFVVNFVVVIILLIVLLILPGVYGPVKSGVVGPLVGGLYEGFGAMNDATIVRTIEVHDSVPARFVLNLDQTTTVEILEPVPLQLPATVDMGNAGQLYATVSLALPAGTKLPVHLQLEVPVSQTIPVDLKVDVNIPLNETELGPQFSRFKTLFEPLDRLIDRLPDDWDQLVACGQRGKLLLDCKTP